MLPGSLSFYSAVLPAVFRQGIGSGNTPPLPNSDLPWGVLPAIMEQRWSSSRQIGSKPQERYDITLLNVPFISNSGPLPHNVTPNPQICTSPVQFSLSQNLTPPILSQNLTPINIFPRAHWRGYVSGSNSTRIEFHRNARRHFTSQCSLR